MDVTRLYADLAKSKVFWAHLPLTDPQSEAHAQAGLAAANRMAATPSQGGFEILLKLAELQDILSEDATPAQAALLASIIEDVQRVMDVPPAPPAKVRPTPSARAAKVDRRARPVVVDGKVYPSITAACQATGISYSELRLRSH